MAVYRRNVELLSIKRYNMDAFDSNWSYVQEKPFVLRTLPIHETEESKVCTVATSPNGLRELRVSMSRQDKGTSDHTWHTVSGYQYEICIQSIDDCMFLPSIPFLNHTAEYPAIVQAKFLTEGTVQINACVCVSGGDQSEWRLKAFKLHLDEMVWNVMHKSDEFTINSNFDYASFVPEILGCESYHINLFFGYNVLHEPDRASSWAALPFMGFLMPSFEENAFSCTVFTFTLLTNTYTQHHQRIPFAKARLPVGIIHEPSETPTLFLSNLDEPEIYWLDLAGKNGLLEVDVGKHKPPAFPAIRNTLSQLLHLDKAADLLVAADLVPYIMLTSENYFVKRIDLPFLDESSVGHYWVLDWKTLTWMRCDYAAYENEIVILRKHHMTSRKSSMEESVASIVEE